MCIDDIQGLKNALEDGALLGEIIKTYKDDLDDNNLQPLVEELHTMLSDVESKKFFVMTASCDPKNCDQWFSGFMEGEEFLAESQEKAQEWLDSQCEEAGTNSDPYYNEYGPAARETE